MSILMNHLSNFFLIKKKKEIMNHQISRISIKKKKTAILSLKKKRKERTQQKSP